MDSKDLIKAAILAALYLFVGPLLGLLIANRPKFQRVAFAAMCFMTISGLLGPGEWGFTLLDEPDYRGHARGFHFYFNEVFAIALLVASKMDRKGAQKWFIPGLIFYLFYLGCSLLSIMNAPQPHYSWMSAFKCFKVILIFLASAVFLRGEGEVEFLLKTMSYTVGWETFVVLKEKYINKIYQVWGTFEHQNSLSMYAGMIGMVLLAAGAGPKRKGSNLFIFGYICCAVIVQGSLSRAGLVIFALFSVVTLFFSFVDKFTKRRLVVTGCLALVALIGVGWTAKTIIKRFNDTGNTESKQTRIDLNIASRQMLHDYPTGIGWNNFALTINSPWHYGDVIDATSRRHNEIVDKKHRKGIVESLYYLLLSETGYPGYVSFLLFIAYFMFLNLKAMWSFRTHFFGAVSIGILCGCGANYLQSLFERVLTQPRNMMLWMILLGITAKFELWRRQKSKQQKTRSSTAQSVRSQAAPQSETGIHA
ncbi:MAG: lipid core-O-antigen ligase-like enyme [Verrucomicrobiales bacterium]|nr:lipid core-O-antigen ligase-like enyme [Verrucomicrobiales bacterium]